MPVLVFKLNVDDTFEHQLVEKVISESSSSPLPFLGFKHFIMPFFREFIFFPLLLSDVFWHMKGRMQVEKHLMFLKLSYMSLG